MKIRISGPAQNDLLEIWTFTNREWGQSQADTYVDGLFARFAWLPGNRARWRIRPDLAAELYSYHHERHIVMFKLSGDVLTVARILHERMDVADRMGDT